MSANPSFWVHHPHPFLFQFSEGVGLRFYGLAYLLGFVATFWLLRKYHRVGRSPIDSGALLDLITYLIAGVIIGGRLGYFLLYTPEQLFHPPWAFFMVWQGGMASHGGFVGVIVAVWWFTRSRKLSLLQVTDVVVTTVPFGLMLGRLANFINGELWGKVATVRWAMVFESTGGGPFPRHPSQIYEAALEGLLLLGFMQWRFWRCPGVQKQTGRLSGEFLVGYSIARAICELFREPDVGIAPLFGLSRGTFYSIFLFAGGLALIAWAARKKSQDKA